jgi:tripartite-type tricarboxylate transporter receptor subunit TctC
MASATKRLRHLLVAEQSGQEPLRSQPDAILASPLQPSGSVPPRDSVAPAVNLPSTSWPNGIRLRDRPDRLRETEKQGPDEMIPNGQIAGYHRGVTPWAAALLCAVALSSPAKADSVSDFYAGKTMTLLIGFPPGGGYDTYVRVLARHYGKFIPGHPAVVPSNMPGAGSLLAANYLYAKAPNDGLTLAMFAASAAMEPLLGNKSALFDAAKFSWIGSMSQDIAYCGVWQTPGAAKTFDEMMTKETIFGGGATAAITYQHPMVLKNVLGANIRVIPGYPGTREVNLALHRGEVNGVCGLYVSTIRASFLDEVSSGLLKPVIQMGNKKSDEYGNVPSVFDFAKTDMDRAVLDVHFKQLLLGRAIAGPPGIPADRLKALRDGLVATMKDKDFLAEAERVGLEIDPASAEEVEQLLVRFAAYPPEVFRKAQEAIGR